MENYIKNQIESHFKKHQIHINPDDLNCIIDETMKGTYAFQIIYEDLPEFSMHEPWYTFKLYKKLKRTNVCYDGNLWSYDGGKQYKYFDSETLVFDLRVIRELKLNQIL
jgi:predicted methyltransferase